VCILKRERTQKEKGEKKSKYGKVRRNGYVKRKRKVKKRKNQVQKAIKREGGACGRMCASQQILCPIT